MATTRAAGAWRGAGVGASKPAVSTGERREQSPGSGRKVERHRAMPGIIPPGRSVIASPFPRTARAGHGQSPATAGYEASGPGRTLTTSKVPLMTPRRYMPALLLLFVASGCAALIYEIVWFQLLQLVIGSSAVSLAVLLGTFMGGMCLGSFLLPRYISRASIRCASTRSSRSASASSGCSSCSACPPSRTSTPRGAVRVPSACCFAPLPPASSCCPRRS